MDMKLSSFVEVYFEDKAPRLKKRSIMTKRTLIETKILPYFGDKQPAVDIIKWQNALLNQEYKPTYLRIIQNQLTAFTKLKSVYKQRTGNTFEDSDYESFGIVDENGNLTNAGALLADELPVRHSRIFCTRWNGLDFVNNNSKKPWGKTGNGRTEKPDYPERAVLEGLVNALIHRNYLQTGSEVHIDMFDDKILVPVYNKIRCTSVKWKGGLCYADK